MTRRGRIFRFGFSSMKEMLVTNRIWTVRGFLALFCLWNGMAFAQPPGQTTAVEQDITETNPGEAMKLEQAFVTRPRQLTFEGRRAGESYFSADGKKMIFQSEREPGNPFFQIYLMDLETGDTERISPGKGKTTCAWIHPDGKRVMFASTQDDPDAEKEQKDEIELRASGKERRYSWDYDEFYEIYEQDLATKDTAS